MEQACLTLLMSFDFSHKRGN